MASRTLTVEIIGDASKLTKSFDKAQRSTKGFSSKIGKALKLSALGGATAGFAGLAAVAKLGFDEFTQGEKIAAQTAAVIKSTGGAANVTAKQVDKLATALMNKSGVDDEAIKSGANMLLTFRGIRNEAGKGNKIFDQATRAALDMSVAMGTDAKSEALALGKALNDPAAGLSKLTKRGVTFTAAQKQLVKTLVETGHTADAQRLILGELRREFGGSAAAAGDTLSGKLNILKETFTNLTGELVGQFAPSIKKVAEQVTEWIQDAENQKKITDGLRKAVKVLGDVFDALVPVVKAIAAAVEKMTEAVGGAKNAVKFLTAAFIAWKAVKIAGAASDAARSFGLLGSKVGAANTGMVGATKGAKGLNSALGKAGLAAGAGVASYELTTLALKATGLDKKLHSLGGTAFDVAAKLGFVNDAGKQFAGKTLLSAGASKFLRGQAARLEAGGLTAAQAAAKLSASHPNVALRDIQVLAGVFGRLPAQPRLAIPAHVGGTTDVSVYLDSDRIASRVQIRQSRTRHRTAPQTRGRVLP